MFKDIDKYSVLVCLSLLLFGCSTIYNPATGKREFILIDSKAETSIGKNVQQELLREKKLSKDPLLKERVERVGSKLAEVSERKDIEYSFYVLEDKDLNAMALPGGFIYVNSGLAKILSDDELAYVVGHEVGHVAARHIAKRLQAGLAYQLIVALAITGAGEGQAEAAQSIAQGVDQVFNLISLGYSRHDEYEADRFGARYAKTAGFDPYASITAMEKIKQEEGPNWKVLGYFRSHPYADDRIAALKKYIPELK